MQHRDSDSKYPTVVCDFTRHQIELLQTSTLFGNDFHTPADKQRKNKGLKNYLRHPCTVCCVSLKAKSHKKCAHTAVSFP